MYRLKFLNINSYFWGYPLKNMEKTNFFKRNQFTFLAILIFLAITFVYLSPLLEGKSIRQGDVEQLRGGFSEVTKYKVETGRYALWTNAMFSGMPTYLLWLGYPSNIAGHISDLYNRIMPNPANTVFLYLVGFFILMKALRINNWLSIAGAIAFAFSSYNFIIIEAGHTNKAIVIGLFAPTLAGVLLAYRGKIWAGMGLTALALALQIKSNHFQMSYYLAIGIALYIIIHFIYVAREKQYANFIKASLALVVAVIIAVGVNMTPLLLTEEYAKESIRGKTELSLDPKASKDGLSEDYAFEYSYGIGETFTLLIPNFYGGPSGGALDKNSETYKFLQSRGVPNAAQMVQQMPLYWGDQLFTAGPVYFGAIVVFLFVLGLFIVKGEKKWWILCTVVLTILLSWGKNFYFLSDLFFNYFPLYNKFRAVSSILTVSSLLFPLLAVLAVKEIIENKLNEKELLKHLRNSLIIVGGLLLIFVVVPDVAGSFTNETKDRATFGEAYEQWITPLAQDRAGLLRADAMRSLAFVVLAAGLIFIYVRKKLNVTNTLILLTVLIIADMWTIDKRYLNNDNFVRKPKNVNNIIQPTNADLQIMQDKDLFYRVYNVTGNPFTESRTSQFHKSIGGYHAAKLKRYQELIEHQISKGNMSVLNMLNTKYFIGTAQAGQEPIAQMNPDACGNAWAIEEIRYVPSADSEMVALSDFNPSITVIISDRFKEYTAGVDLTKDSAASVELKYYSPDTLTYISAASKENFVVFSDIYYDKGWNVYIDGEKADYIRVNYVLRGMRIPAGNHEVEFRFEPARYYLGEKISMASSVLLVIVLGLSIYFSVRNNEQSIDKL